MAALNKPTIQQMRQALQSRKTVPHLARGGNDFDADSITPGGRGRAKFSAPSRGPQIIKETGGNWVGSNVAAGLKPLLTSAIAGETPAQRIPHHEALLQDPSLNQDQIDRVKYQLEQTKQEAALDNWVHRNLTNYVKKQMATKDDPVRGLFEQGITHIDPASFNLERERAFRKRLEANQPQLGQTASGKSWENAADAALSVFDIGKLHPTFHEPWMENAPKDTKVVNADDLSGLGFDHIMDVLRQDVNEGRIRPEQLNKISMEQAVRRVHEFDQEQAKKMRDAAIKNTEGMPVHKEYPSGHKWIELALPKVDPKKELPEGYSLRQDDRSNVQDTPWHVVDQHGAIVGGDQGLFFANPEDAIANTHTSDSYDALSKALKYEGDTMGHCVGGYTPDVLEGRSRIFSLRDAKGEPHVTIETKPQTHLDYNSWFRKQPEEIQNKIAQRRMEDKSHDIYEGPEYLAARAALLPKIQQIKGKQNRAPNKEYLPMVQDFVKSGHWSQVGDAQNAGLRKYGDVFNVTEQRNIEKTGEQVPEHEWLAGEDIQRLHNAITPPGKRLKYDANGHIVGHEGEYAKGGTIRMANGGSTSDLGYQSPSVAQMREEMRNFNPVANARQTLSSAYTNLKAVPSNLQRLAADPAKYLKDLPAPTEDQLLNALSPGNVGMAGIMIGPRARTFSAANAAKAEAMEKAGQPQEKIWQDTGTYRGPDGAWRQEINDQPAQFQFRGDIKAKAKTAQSEIDAMKAQIKDSLAREKEVKADLFPKEAVAARKTIKGQATTKSEVLNDIHGLASDPIYTGNYLKHAYEHPELYAAYPELQQYVMRQGADAGPGSLGSLAGENVNVYKYGLTRNPKKTTTHELQHAIQAIEDTPRGSNPDEFWNARQMARDRIIDHNTELTKISDLMNKAGTPEDMAALQTQYLATMAERDKLVPYAHTDPFQEYQRTSGEAEARMVENRLEMSPAERAATHPMKSYGQYEPSGLPVDPSDLIMLKHGEKIEPGYANGGAIRLAKGGSTGDIDEMNLELFNKTNGGIISTQQGNSMIQRKADGGPVTTLEQMKAQLMQRPNFMGLGQLQSVGVKEAPGLDVKSYVSPTGPINGRNLPVGGIDMSLLQPGQQMMPPPPPQQPGQPGQPQGAQGSPGQPPQAGGPPPPQGQMPPGQGSNILQMTPQGQAMAAMRPSSPGMARGGNVQGYAGGSRVRPQFAIAPATPVAKGPEHFTPYDHSNPTMKSLATAFDEAIAHHLSLSPEERAQNSIRAAEKVADVVGRTSNGTPKDLLGKNEKLLKSEAGYDGGKPVELPDGRGIETTGLALAPAYREGKFDTCPNHQSCKAECLGKTSGNYFKLGGGKDMEEFLGPRLNSLKKTHAFMHAPHDFAVKLHDEIHDAKAMAAQNGNHLGLRLNVLSDINPRVHKSIINAHPDVTFYDYTKNNTDPIASNHHYTYSSTGVSQPGVHNEHQNWKSMRRRLDQGDNVAMAFSDKHHLPEELHDQETGKRYKVVNGDMHDFRPLDLQPEGEDGVIVGLKNKKATGTTHNAHAESHGFFVHYDPQLQMAKNAKGQPVYARSKPGSKSMYDTIPQNRAVSIQPQARPPIQLTNDDGSVA